MDVLRIALLDGLLMWFLLSALAQESWERASPRMLVPAVATGLLGALFLDAHSVYVHGEPAFVVYFLTGAFAVYFLSTLSVHRAVTAMVLLFTVKLGGIVIYGSLQRSGVLQAILMSATPSR